MNTQQIGIRELVEFLLKTGDLSTVSGSENNLLEGAKIHRKIQKSRPENYDSEVGLSTLFEFLNTKYKISGRADGILRGKKVLIEEIKTSDLEFKDVPKSTLTLYWGQVKVYAYILMNHENLENVNLRLTYVQTPDEKITQKVISYSKDEADKFFNDLIGQFKDWLKLRHDLDEARVSSAKALKFPFKKYRTGQHKLAANVYKTILLKKHLFVEAPTGTGKTISTMFPAVKAMGEKLIKRIFYLTAKQSTRQVAEEAVGLMRKNGLNIKSITLTAKDKVIFDEERDLSPEENPYMLGYYDRIRPAIKDIIENENQITKEIIQKYAKKHQVDPFEFSLDVSLFCDVIICDYNYLFDPQVHLQRFFSVQDKSNCFLIDEAHNLVSRSREMYSADLSSEPITQLAKDLSKNKKKNTKVVHALQALKRSFQQDGKPALQTKDLEISQESPLDDFNDALEKLVETIHKWLVKIKSGPDVDEILDYYFDCRHYLLISQFFDQTYRMRILSDGTNFIFRQFCMDPSAYLCDTLSLGRAAILFSATLSPMNYYQQVLGNEEDSLKLSAPSTFPSQNCEIIIQSDIVTTYTHRKASIQPIITTIKNMIDSKTGHYLIFFPSNEYLNEVCEAFKTEYPSTKVIAQQSGMDSNQRKKFIDEFRTDLDKPKLGFALLGGIFSEGIDLKGRQLIGIGIVSVGLQAINPESNLIRKYFDLQNGHGFEFAYQLPGFNNVTQAAGRLIRTSMDKGIIVLMDQRFVQRRYREIFPAHLKNIRISSNQSHLKDLLTNFWTQQEVSEHIPES